MEAAHKLVTSHLRLVAKIAMGYRGYGLPVGELISEGNVGMMQAVKRFDPDRGFRLATYAMWWIRAAIQEYILHSWSLVKMGTTAAQKKLFFNLRRLKGQMQAIDDGDLQPEQVAKIARMLDVPEQDVVSMNRRLAAPDHSLNAPVRQDSEGEWQDWLVDETDSQETSLRRPRGTDRPQGAAVERAQDAERARAPHPDRAPAEGQSDHARGSVAAVRHLARAGAPDRGARLREAAEGDEGADRRAPAAVAVGHRRASGVGHGSRPITDRLAGASRPQASTSLARSARSRAARAMLSASSAARTAIGVDLGQQPAGRRGAPRRSQRRWRLPSSAVAVAMLWPAVHSVRSGSTAAAMLHSAMLRARGRPGS